MLDEYFELGKVNVFFGKVVGIDDEMKVFRCQIAIEGYTDKLEPEKLPWYYPWQGINYLPEIDEIVSVVVFDANFTTAFYGNKIDNTGTNVSTLDGLDYQHYLEIFKRTITDGDGEVVSLTYTNKTGIEFENDTSKIQIEREKISLFVGANSIVMVEDKIDIGNKSLEPVIQGDKGVQELHDIIKHQQNIINSMILLFDTTATAASASPFTKHIGAALKPLTPTEKSKLTAENKKVDAAADTIQSKMVFTGV